MSIGELTNSLGLPPAPTLFVGGDWCDSGPPPDPHAVYCPAGHELYDYQHDGVQFLLENPSVLLGDEMGLGKSIQAIAAARLLIHRGEVSRVLILCPRSVLYDWYTKLKQWAPDLRVVPVEGPKRRRTWYWRCRVHVNIIGYETWREDLKQGLANPADFDLVILDEAHRIKNAKTVTYQAVTKLQPARRWGLTGTPLENRLDELVALFTYLRPGLLHPGREYTPTAVRAAIAPHVMRRRKADVLHHLPPKETRTMWLELTPVQRMAYDAAERAAVQRIREAGKASAPMLALAHLTRLKLICCMDSASGASCKLDFLEQEFERLLAQGDKAIFFSQYPEKVVRPLLPRLSRFGAALFDGKLGDWDRQLLIHRFQNQEHPQVLALSLKCGGLGITLTRANHVYHFDSWWNATAAQQAEDRTHRIGQKKPVYVTTLLTRDTVEERIAQIVAEKQELFRQIMDPLTEQPDESLTLGKLLTKDDLLRVFGLH